MIPDCLVVRIGCLASLDLTNPDSAFRPKRHSTPYRMKHARLASDLALPKDRILANDGRSTLKKRALTVHLCLRSVLFSNDRRALDRPSLGLGANQLCYNESSLAPLGITLYPTAAPFVNGWTYTRALHSEFQINKGAR